MSYNSLKTTLAAAAVISVGALAFSTHAEAYWRHHHRHVAFVPVASMSAPAPAGYGMNGGYGTCIKRDPVWTTRGWRSDWVIDCAGKGAGYGGTAYYGAPVAAVAPVGYGYAGYGGYGGYGYGGGPLGGLFGGLFGW
jgi:hypothetical protein